MTTNSCRSLNSPTPPRTLTGGVQRAPRRGRARNGDVDADDDEEEEENITLSAKQVTCAARIACSGAISPVADNNVTVTFDRVNDGDDVDEDEAAFFCF